MINNLKGSGVDLKKLWPYIILTLLIIYYNFDEVGDIKDNEDINMSEMSMSLSSNWREFWSWESDGREMIRFTS